MAAGAGHRLVLAGQGVGGLRMVEPRRRLPPLLRMALLTLMGQLLPVLVEVAGDACGGKAQVGLDDARVGGEPLPEIGGEPALLVTLLAGHLRVLPVERKAC